VKGRRSASGARIIAAAREWIGTPYHDQASVKGVGADCLGLARGVWREVIGREPTGIPPYTRDWGEVGSVEVFAATAGRWMIPVSLSEARPGALLVFRMREGAIAKHCGILSDVGTIIHSYDRLGVIEEPYTDAWRRRLAFVFLYPQRRDVKRKSS